MTHMYYGRVATELPTRYGSTFIRPGQLNLSIKDQLKINLLFLRLQNFVSYGRAGSSCMRQNFHIGRGQDSFSKMVLDWWIILIQADKRGHGDFGHD